MDNQYYHVRVDDDIRRRFQAAVPWGFQGHIVEELMKLFCSFSDEHGPLVAVSLMLEDQATLKQKERPVELPKKPLTELFEELDGGRALDLGALEQKEPKP